ncbi:MAG: hypothetical protein JW793_12710 [Acidobacteria bacterium]|nr:hypothetical protein [Acidobacteriota bacterium]
MITDPRPRIIARRDEYDRSDKMAALSIPDPNTLHALSLKIESALSSESTQQAQSTCGSLLAEASGLFHVPRPKVRVLDARPLRVYETGSSELFGDYHEGTALIRVWMRTAIRKRVTSFGTFLSTLCHEFCHHLDIHGLGFPNTFHTRGFYERTAVLYHCCRGTPYRRLVWRPGHRNRWTIDWVQMRPTRTQK